MELTFQILINAVSQARPAICRNEENMNMKIDEIRRIYASQLNAAVPQKKEDIAAGSRNGERDSYIPSVGGGESIQTTGNYDDQGRMDDDFSFRIGDGNDNISQIAQYSMEYARQTVKTVTESEMPGDGMNRPQ